MKKFLCLLLTACLMFSFAAFTVEVLAEMPV